MLTSNLIEKMIKHFAFVLLCLFSTQICAMTVDFNNADIRALVSAVSKATGKNIIVDQKVKGKVTVYGSENVPDDALFDVFESILEVNGFSLIKGKHVSKVIPSPDAKYSSTYGGANSEGFVTKVIKARHVDVAKLVPILRPMLPQHAHLASHEESKTIVIADNYANIEKIKRVISRIDSESSNGLQIINLNYASASEVSRMVKDVFSERAGARLRISPDLRTNSVIVSANESDEIQIRAMIAHLDTPLDSSSTTSVLYLKYAKAKELSETLNRVADVEVGVNPSKNNKVTTSGERVFIEPDIPTNSIIIKGDPDKIKEIKSIVERLDIRRAQVLVEAIIAEVSSDMIKTLGVQWGYRGASGELPVGLVNFNLGGDALTSLAGSSVENIPNVNGLSLALGNADKLGAVLRALGTDVNSNILSTPSIVTLDNEQAEIVVGVNVPFVTGSYSSTSSGANPNNPFQTIERDDVGVSLSVKPQINDGDAVKLDVVQEVSGIVTSAVDASDIVINKRSIETSVMVDDGGILVLGGLIDEQVTETEQKVPVLGDIPLLGGLFRYTKDSKVKRNLMVFLRPRILRDQKDNEYATYAKYSALRDDQLLMKDGRRSMRRSIVGFKMPVLDGWEDIVSKKVFVDVDNSFVVAPLSKSE